MVELTQEAMLTVGGIAVFVALFTQLLVKPALKKFKDKGWYDIVLNVISVALGVGGAILAQAAVGALEYASVLDAVLVGFSGAAVAALGYEGVKNVKAYIQE